MKKFIAGLALMCGLFLLPCTVNAAVPYAGVFRALNEEFKDAEYEVQINEIMKTFDQMDKSLEILSRRVKSINQKLDNYISEISSKEMKYSDADIDLASWIALAEAEGEPEYGIRLVIDTMLNRVDSEDFPDTVKDVIYQKGQFSCVWDGRANKVGVEDYIRNLVIEEIENRTDSNVMFFRTKHYGYGTPYMKVGHHYFST